MPVRLLPLILMLALALALPGAAHAEFFPADPIDGPGADIRSVGDLDVARDGSGAVAYVRRDAGVDHVWVSRLVNGTWQAPTRVDSAVTGAGSPAVAASDGGRLLIAFVSDGTLFTTAWTSTGQAFTPPAALAAGGTSPSADMSINGFGYVSFTLGADVRVARFERDQGAGTPVAAPLDIDPAQAAGDTTARRSRVVVSADGTTLVVWGEAGGDGRDHVVARRVFGLNLSTAPQDLTLSDVNGVPAGSADSPDVDVEDDSSYAWVVFRQAFAYPGGTRRRAIARRLVGSQFEAPRVVDALGDVPSEDTVTPRIDISGRGVGLAVSGGSSSHATFGALLREDDFLGAQRLDSGDNAVDPGEVPAMAENSDAVLAWRTTAGGAASVHARRFDANPESRLPPPPGPDVTISRPEFGAVDADAGMDAAANRSGDVVVVFVQGTGAERRLVAGVYDRTPSSFAGHTATRWRNFARPPLSWQAAFDLWGPVNYVIEVDGQPIGQTTETRYVPVEVVPDGIHTWRVVATDRRGQVVRSKPRLLRVDANPPALSFRISGTRSAGKAIKVSATASDAISPTTRSSGVKVVKIDFGDGTPPVSARTAQHRYRRGSYTIRVSATDVAGNAGVLTRSIRIKKKK